MSIVCAAIKNGTVAISSDTMVTFGSLNVSAKHRRSAGKLFSINKSVVGLVGWQAVSNMMEHLIIHDRKLFRLDGRMEIYDTMLKLHGKMKDEYFIETKENEDDQPVESSQLAALIVNKQGIFAVGSFREVNEYQTFWAIGSGRRISLGAMHALHDQKVTARRIAEAGVKAAAEFDESCALPLTTRTVRLDR